MPRLCCLAIAAVAVSGLQLGDVTEPQQLLDTGAVAVSTLDPELTNTKGEKFHVSVPGEYVMIAMPPEADLGNPGNADLVIKAQFEQVGRGCDDLLIRSITLQGNRLGRDISGHALTALKFYVKNDVFNETRVLGLQSANTDRPDLKDDRYEDFLAAVPQVKIVRPRGNIHKPTKKSYRNRQHMFHATVALTSGPHEIHIWWSNVWRGLDGGDRGQAVYVNDLSFTVSNVGENPAGLLGTDDHTEATKTLRGCFKKQPVLGPYQVHERRKAHVHHGR